MDVLEYCNQLIGEKQIQMLSAEECYVLIMACFLHDIGMGISQKDYEEFSREIPFGDYLLTHDKENEMCIVRDFHNEYSCLFIRKYANLFNIPSEDFVFSIVQVSRGHRKTDLFDGREYPDIKLGDGLIRTAYLAAIIRLADEIDVGSARNPELLFDYSGYTDQEDIDAFETHKAIRSVEVGEKQIVLHVRLKEQRHEELVRKIAGKLQRTLDYCRKVAEERSDLRITQREILITKDA